MGFTSGGYIVQRGLGRAQFRKLETVASRLSHCDHFYGNRQVDYLRVVRPQSTRSKGSFQLPADPWPVFGIHIYEWRVYRAMWRGP